MAQLINEAKRFQQLAGIITENENQSLEEKMSYDDFEQMIKPFLDLAKSKGWVWNSSGDSWFDISSPAIALYHSTELPTTADGEYKGQKMLASKDVTIGNQVQTYRGNIEKKQGDVIMQPDYGMDQAYFQSKDKAILDAIKASMSNSTDVVQDAKESSSQLTSSKDFEPVKYYSMILRKKAASAAAPQQESQLNEGWDDFNATGWMARIKDLAKEMGYDASTGWDDQNTDRARLQAADEAGKGEKKAYIGTVDDGNTIVVTFTLDKDNKDQNKANIQKKIVDLYKNDANVSLGRQTHGDTLMQVIIKDKTKSQPQQESIEQAVNEALKAYRKKK